MACINHNNLVRSLITLQKIGSKQEKTLYYTTDETDLFSTYQCSKFGTFFMCHQVIHAAWPHNNSSAIAQMVCVFLVNLHHSHNQKPHHGCKHCGFLWHNDVTVFQSEPSCEMLWFHCLNTIYSWYQNIPLLGSDKGTITSHPVPQQSPSVNVSCGANNIPILQTIYMRITSVTEVWMDSQMELRQQQWRTLDACQKMTSKQVRTHNKLTQHLSSSSSSLSLLALQQNVIRSREQQTFKILRQQTMKKLSCTNVILKVQYIGLLCKFESDTEQKQAYMQHMAHN